MAARDAKLFKVIFKAIEQFYKYPERSSVVIDGRYIAKKPTLKILRYLLPQYRVFKDDNELVNRLYLSQKTDLNLKRLVLQPEPILTTEAHDELDKINKLPVQQQEESQNKWAEKQNPEKNLTSTASKTPVPEVVNPQTPPPAQPIIKTQTIDQIQVPQPTQPPANISTASTPVIITPTTINTSDENIPAAVKGAVSQSVQNLAADAGVKAGIKIQRVTRIYLAPTKLLSSAFNALKSVFGQGTKSSSTLPQSVPTNPPPGQPPITLVNGIPSLQSAPNKFMPSMGGGSVSSATLNDFRTFGTNPQTPSSSSFIKNFTQTPKKALNILKQSANSSLAQGAISRGLIKARTLLYRYATPGVIGTAISGTVGGIFGYYATGTATGTAIGAASGGAAGTLIRSRAGGAIARGAGSTALKAGGRLALASNPAGIAVLLLDTNTIYKLIKWSMYIVFFLLFAIPIFLMINKSGALVGPGAQVAESSSPGESLPPSSQCLAGDFNNYIQNYDFYQKDSTAYTFPNPSQHLQEFNIIKEKAINATKTFQNVNAPLLAWWVFYETGGHLDSYSWSNCKDSNHDVNYNCPSTSSGGWQLGYGQQYGDTVNRLAQAFQTTYGEPSNAARTQQVGQNVLNKAGQSKIFPNKSVNQLLSEPDSQYWISVLMRDPDISMYLLASVFSGYSSSPTLKDRAFGWSSYYQTTWQATSNLMNDILLAWGSSPQCQQILPPIPSPTTCTSGNPQACILANFNINIERGFSSSHYQWVYDILSRAYQIAPNFGILIHKNCSQITLSPRDGTSYTAGCTINLNTSTDERFSKLVVIHELGHMIHNTNPSYYENNITAARNSDKGISDLGFLTRYSELASSPTDFSSICYSSYNGQSYHDDEDFAESVTYYINTDISESAYAKSSSDPCNGTRWNQNPYMVVSANGLKYKAHLEFIKQILGK